MKVSMNNYHHYHPTVNYHFSTMKQNQHFRCLQFVHNHRQSPFPEIFQDIFIVTNIIMQPMRQIQLRAIQHRPQVNNLINVLPFFSGPIDYYHQQDRWPMLDDSVNHNIYSSIYFQVNLIKHQRTIIHVLVDIHWTTMTHTFIRICIDNYTLTDLFLSLPSHEKQTNTQFYVLYLKLWSQSTTTYVQKYIFHDIRSFSEISAKQDYFLWLLFETKICVLITQVASRKRWVDLHFVQLGPGLLLLHQEVIFHLLTSILDTNPFHWLTRP